jgi:biopolymer transport protein ExbD
MAKRELQEINAGSMADIAFLLLIFFLVATTMDVDTGLTRLLPAIPEKDEQVEVKVNKRNVLVVLINRNDQLMVGGEFGTRLDELKDITMNFFQNPTNDPTLPEKEPSEVQFPVGSSPLLPPDGLWRGNVSKGVISLQNDRSTTYKKYLLVQNELVAAVNQLRQDFCKLYFDKDYDALNMNSETEKEISEGIRKVYKMNISEAEPKNIGGLN